MRNAIPITDTATLKRLYEETVDLFRECGGSYRSISESTYLNILDALSHGRYVITRDGDTMTRALFYWMIRPEDVEAVKHGLPPPGKDGGTIVYVCEHAGRDGAKGAIAAVRKLKDRYGSGTSVCWHDRYVRPDWFRFFRRTPA